MVQLYASTASYKIPEGRVKLLKQKIQVFLQRRDKVEFGVRVRDMVLLRHTMFIIYTYFAYLEQPSG